MTSLLKERMLHSEQMTLIVIDSSELTPSLKDFISVMATGKIADRVQITEWSPPAFRDAEQEIHERCRNEEQIVPLGQLDGKMLNVSLCGYVTCVSDEDYYDRHYECCLHIDTPQGAKDIKVFILGSVDGYGTAVLMDENQNIWLYNPPDALDPTLPNFDGKAFVILSKGEIGRTERVLEFGEMYDAGLSSLMEDHN